MTESALAALEHLRDSSRIQWYVIPLLLLVLYVYAVEVERRNVRVLGVNNRIVFAVVNAWLAVGIEVVLNRIGMLTWDWSWWDAGTPYLIFLVGYLPFFAAAFLVYDLPRVRHKVIAVGTIFAVGIAGVAIFAPIGWL